MQFCLYFHLNLKMEMKEGITDNSISFSQKTFKIKTSYMSKKAAFPVHEEYKLQKARIDYVLNMNTICNNVLRDMKTSKMGALQECEKRGIFLNQSEVVVADLNRRRMAFVERSNRFLDESIRQLKILNKGFHIIGTEAHDIEKDLNLVLRSEK